ncbi:Tumor necrosis factor receptor superfamily member 14 [Anabarilius grahami]|uniref:Tumor necrosis factor receptor superfamily member 14 n=1 Tax=Anabarilius grahami TaxID=495550 RepID=A0A3N0YS21_ANAGA|nr:Tumor necrosis factor receptor superfamily member 14 [Anabarilius grahami]
MLTLRITVLITVIVSLNYEFCFCGCAHAEYEIDGQCCPMCAPGNRVLWHCTEYTSTTCVPCPELTYIDEPSGFTKCFTCTVCDDGRGLRVNKACTRSSDTVCGPLKGFYCTERNKGSCRFAVKHSECSPGQYIKQAEQGLRVNRTCTRSIDTVCEPLEGFYCFEQNKGSCRFAVKHSECDPGQYIRQAGTTFTDTDCGNCTEGTYSNGSFTTCQPHSK